MATYEECIAGQRFISPSASLRIEFAKARLAAQINSSTSEWCVIGTPEIHVGDDVVVPDLAGWRMNRLPPPDGLVVDVVPEWVCEFVTLVSGACDRIQKLPLYARWGVNHAWYVDAVERGVELWRRQDKYWAILGGHEDSETFRAAPFDLDIKLETLWLEE